MSNTQSRQHLDLTKAPVKGTCYKNDLKCGHLKETAGPSGRAV